MSNYINSYNRLTKCSKTSKKVLSFYYNGGTRFVEPFCYGIHRSTDKEVLRGYQIGGYSESGESVGWKLFRVEEISKLMVTDRDFKGVREHYNPNDRIMKKIICRNKMSFFHELK